MKSFVITTALLVVCLALLLGGILAVQPSLALPWMCLSVPLAFVAGRGSHALLRGRRLALVRDESAPYQMPHRATRSSP